ncbi:hypothetical protein IMCC3135_09400 [Granulosicoccus antarcticus IMCC3135]|uniref:Uncharacterized protein n=2 Tax=Granulosicoccus TaxID=437504 RepID=A0A2Z2NWA2_9GAMM|nr:hypothetical protein IMCC3135_09400 [Granulosicoccus antarcticus IMCC3135]
MLQSSLPQLLQSLGTSIAEAQYAMDRTSVDIASRMGETMIIVGDGGERSLLELGFVPSFYHLSTATIEARVAFSTTETTEIGVSASIGGSFKLFSASVNASYSNKYSFSSEGASTLVANFVSVPAPDGLRDLMAAQTL